MGGDGEEEAVPTTKLLAQSNPAGDAVDPLQSKLAQLDVAAYEAMRLSVGNWVNSPAALVIDIAHINEPNTPNANAITALDTFVVAPGESVSRLYEVPGDTVLISASPETQASGCSVFFTVYARTN
jgi:hypothetical protein